MATVGAEERLKFSAFLKCSLRSRSLAYAKAAIGQKLERSHAQVLNELVLELPEGELAAVRDALPTLMGCVTQLKVPLLVEVGVGANRDAAH